MKYYLVYLTESGKEVKIDLSGLPFFAGKSSGKILNIIGFYNNFDTPDDMLEYLYDKGLVSDDATPDFRIVIQRKNKYGKDFYQKIPHSDIPLVSCTKSYFDKDVLRDLVIKKFKDDEFVEKLKKEFGFLKDYQTDTALQRYLSYIYNYNRENHEYERDAAEEYERCTRNAIKILFSSPKVFATLAMFMIDYVTPKVLKISFRPQYLDDSDYEEFLEANDIVKYNPGLTGKALEEAIETEELFKEEEWEKRKGQTSL